MIRILKNTVLILSLIVFTTCIDDDYDKKYSTFEEENITSYLDVHPELYSEFSKLLEAVGIGDLLNAYGTYTCFAPTNEALQRYYAEKETSFEQLTGEDIKDIVYGHLLQEKILSVKFPNGALSAPTMNNRFINMTYSQGVNNTVITINDKSQVIAMDQQVHNGVVHTVDHVLEYSKVLLPDMIARNERFKLFAEALVATGMRDSLKMMDDPDYVQRQVFNTRPGGGLSYYWTPPFLKRGATAFLESDSTYHANEIHNLDDLKDYAKEIYDEVYPADRDVTDVTDRRNSLNRFVSYHLMNRVQSANEFISEDISYFYVSGTPIYQYMEMMCPYTLLEISTGNLINKRRNGSAIRLLTVNQEAQNGVYHEIDGILTYDKDLEDDVLNKRLRIDIGSMIPELITNKLKRKDIGDYDRWYIPQGYMSTLTFSEETQPNYISCTCWCNLDGDEFMMGLKYDLTLRTPPLPAGTYEIRCGFAAYGNRGVMQTYFDGLPCGIPVDMNMTGDNPKIGWSGDFETDDDGVSNDKMMRNRGYMKGPNSIFVTDQIAIMRNDIRPLRKILLTKTLDKTEPHYIRFKSVENRTDRQCHLDYMEFMPIHLIATEGKD
jgi:uncharacterized surface protein with fasciclin (FAS1) repeats